MTEYIMSRNNNQNFEFPSLSFHLLASGSEDGLLASCVVIEIHPRGFHQVSLEYILINIKVDG